MAIFSGGESPFATMGALVRWGKWGNGVASKLRKRSRAGHLTFAAAAPRLSVIPSSPPDTRSFKRALFQSKRLDCWLVDCSGNRQALVTLVIRQSRSRLDVQRTRY